VAGNGTPVVRRDNGPATSAQLWYPSGVAVDSAGNLYVADTSTTASERSSNGVSHHCGRGRPVTRRQRPGTSAQVLYSLRSRRGLHRKPLHRRHWSHRIRKVSNGVITTVAGNGTCCFSGDNGPANGAQVYFPEGSRLDSAGDLYIADNVNNRIRKVSNGVISTVAGTPGRKASAATTDRPPALN